MKLRLYVAGSSDRSERAEASVRAFAETVLGETEWHLEVVDVRADPARAEEDRILATPTLIRVDDGPQRRIVGDLASSDQLRDLLRPALDER